MVRYPFTKARKRRTPIERPVAIAIKTSMKNPIILQLKYSMALNRLTALVAALKSEESDFSFTMV